MAFEYTFVRVFKEERAKEREEGREEGRAEARVEDILELLGENGSVPDDLKKRISDQKDMGTLKDWHKMAAKARSVEEFKQQISVSG